MGAPVGICGACGKGFVGRDKGAAVGDKLLCLYCLADHRSKKTPPKTPGAAIARLKPAPVQVEPCANCGGIIGAMETPYISRDKIVCGPCNARLQPPTLAFVPPP